MNFEQQNTSLSQADRQ